MIVAYATKGLTYVCLSGGSKVDDFSVVSVEGEQSHKYCHQTNQRQDWKILKIMTIPVKLAI